MLTKNFPVFSILSSGTSGRLICKGTTNSKKYICSATFLGTYINLPQKINMHFPFTFKVTLIAYMAESDWWSAKVFKS
jgi:hypothetical protein